MPHTVFEQCFVTLAVTKQHAHDSCSIFLESTDTQAHAQGLLYSKDMQNTASAKPIKVNISQKADCIEFRVSSRPLFDFLSEPLQLHLMLAYNIQQHSACCVLAPVLTQ